MESAILFHLPRSKEDKNPKSEEWVGNFCLLDGSTFTIIGRVECEQRHLIEPKFKEAITKAKSKNATLIIPKLSNIPNTIENFTYLQNSKVKFKFPDFPPLTTSSLPILTSYLNYLGQDKSQKIKAALHKRKAKGAKLGNPNIANKVIQSKASEKRTFLAYTDERNSLARKRIKKLKQEGYNNNQIAKILNQEGLKPRRGKQFYAKTIERLVLNIKELEAKFMSSFELNKEVDKLSHKLRNENRKSRHKDDLPIIKIPNQKNFEKVIEIDFKYRKDPIQLIITLANNQSYPAYKKNHTLHPWENRISIDIDQHSIPPGLYYLRIQSKEYKTLLHPILIKASQRPR